MKRTLTLISLILCGLLAVNGQAPTKADAAELTSLLNEFLAGASKNDPAVHERFWADDLIYTRSTGVRTNKKEILDGLRTAPPRKPSDPVSTYTAEDVVIHQYSNTAVVAFRLMISTTRPDGTTSLSNNLNTGTFLKRHGKWQVIAWQSTVAPIKQDNSNPVLTTPPIKPISM